MSDKMFSLIFWTGSGRSSVVKTEQIKMSKKYDSVVKLRNKNFPVKILLQDDNEEYLNKQIVDEAGNLITKAAEPTTKVTNPGTGKRGKGAGRGRKAKEPNSIDAEVVDQPSIFETPAQNDVINDQLESSALKSKKKANVEKLRQGVVKGSKQMDHKDEDQSSECSDDGPTGGKDLRKKKKLSNKAGTISAKLPLIDSDDKVLTVENKPKKPSRQEKEPNSDFLDAELSDSRKKKKLSNEAGTSSAKSPLIDSDDEELAFDKKPKRLSHRDKNRDSDFSDAKSPEQKSKKRKGAGANENKLKKLRREESSSSNDSIVDSSDKSGNSLDPKLVMEFMKCYQNTMGQRSKVKNHRKDKKLKSKEVELVEKSEIMVNRFKLDLITQTYRKNPREMARQLFKLILGTDRLAKMSVTETKRHEKVPDKYLESIFGELKHDDVAQLL